MKLNERAALAISFVIRLEVPEGLASMIQLHAFNTTSAPIPGIGDCVLPLLDVSFSACMHSSDLSYSLKYHVHRYSG